MVRTNICGDNSLAWTIKSGTISILAYVYATLQPERKSWLVQHRFMDGALTGTVLLPMPNTIGGGKDKHIQQLIQGSLSDHEVSSFQPVGIEIEEFSDLINGLVFEITIDSEGSAFLMPRDLQFLKQNQGRVSIDMSFRVGERIGSADAYE